MNNSTCSVDGCDSAIHVKKKQLCQAHYNRLCYSGSVEIPPVPTKCLGCDKPPRAAKAVGTKPKYCSDRCRSLVHQRNHIASGKYAEALEAQRLANAAKVPPTVACVVCDKSFVARSATRKFCSSKCSNKHLDIHNPVRCSESDCDRGARGKGLCAMHWRRKARAEGREANPTWDDARRANYHKRRAQKLGTQVEDLRPIDIYERDIWLCGLCVTPVDPDCAWPDPMSPSLDHILPLSKGGTHTYENVQLAHLTCNVSKGNRIAA